ncbi:MAG: sulfite exporter TauE/SafE family protein [Chromatocurvus sp.]
MADLQTWQYVCIGLLFIWSGFVRSGLGFGGAVLTLPFLLMVVNAPLVFLPLISVHLLFFSALTIALAHWKLRRTAAVDPGGDAPSGTVNRAFLRYALPLMLVPKLLGVAGVITLPANVVSGFIFTLVSVYAISYILNRPFRSRSRRVDALFMMIGGYISGTSLIAAPLVVPVAASRVPPEQLRDTLFVLWFILVGIKLIAFVLSGVDLQWVHHLWLLPCAAAGHVLGLRFHRYTLRAETAVFFRVLGVGLLTVSLAGLTRILLSY